MKEITRRLYTKPVMLGLAFLAAAALAAGLFVTTKSSAAGPPIPAGDDLFETTGNGETYHNFQASPIPVNFFGPTSEEFKGVVPLVGVALPGRNDDIDTIIHRNGCISTPCTMGIQMTALNLKGINSITVGYSDPQKPDETWTVEVNLSTAKTSGGTMSFNAGGTSFDSTLKVWPKFTFRRVPDGETRVLDTGGGSGLAAVTDGSGGSNSLAAVSDSAVFQPAPEPIATVAPCSVVAVDDFESRTTMSAAAASGCAPVTLTSINNPWPITRPLTEQELLASHNASPPGTKRKVIQADVNNVNNASVGLR